MRQKNYHAGTRIFKNMMRPLDILENPAVALEAAFDLAATDKHLALSL